MRKIADWFHEWFIRDVSRDKLADALNALGIGATMAERGRHEEALKREDDSLGLIEIAQGPVKWINVVCHTVRGGGGSSSTTYWYVFGIPGEREFASGQERRSEDLGLRARRVELSSVRRKGLPVFGSVKRVEWKGYDGGGLISALSMTPEVEAFCIRHGDLYIALHYGAFQGWTVEMKKKSLSYQDWVTVETIARLLLYSG